MCHYCVNFCYHLRFRVWETGLTATYQALYNRGSMGQWYSIFSLVAEVLLIIQTKTTLALVLQLPDYCPTLPGFRCSSPFRSGLPQSGEGAAEAEATIVWGTAMAWEDGQRRRRGPMCGFSQTAEMVSPSCRQCQRWRTSVQLPPRRKVRCKAAKEVANCRLY
jgi:hypothetical protein